ncbi:amidohydrolase family protein [Labrys sp. La1]|uniref:amidohydrolase family protein n=1 Tax=Labrys sp. La1 TaxID=3404917 RepID=UPI003EBE8632
MSRVLIRNATILAMGGEHGSTPFGGDILVEGNCIAAIGPDLGDHPGARLIDGRGRLVMPGLVNAHTHSGETFFRGRYERLPLELWLLYAYPLLMGPLLPPRLLYLRTLLLAMESLKGGVTLLCDDFFDPPRHDLDRLGTVFRAYEDAGIRANVSSAVMNIHPLDAVAYGRQIMPADLQAKLDFGPPITASAYVDYCRSALAAFQDRAGRLRFMIAPSAPQRCTPELMLACNELARQWRVPFHTHILETKTQAVTGELLHGKSLIRYLHDLGLLHSGITIAHSVWVDEDDIALMGAAGCSVAHNAVSNLKLGAGIAPLRRLIDAGVTIGLGTDGVSSNDSARIFDVMRTAALVQSATGPDHERWVSAREILNAATLGGAHTALLGELTGSLEVGKRADLIMLRLDSLAFTPLNDIVRQLVYAENGASIERVMVEGEIVVEQGLLTRIDEEAVLAEIREAMPAFLTEHAEIEARNAIFHPYFEQMHQRATALDVGMDRYAGTRG